MTVSHSGTYVQLPKLGLAQILAADTTTRKTLVTGDVDGNKITAINACSTDNGNDRVVQIWVSRGGLFYLLNTVNVPLTSGFVIGIPPVSLMNGWVGLPLDNDGQRYFHLMSGDVLSVAVTVTMSAAKEVDVMAVYGSF